MKQKPAPRPLNATSLNELAMGYVGRFATSRAKLLRYLQRKLREREWEDEAPADLDALAERMVGYGYVDDAAYAGAKARGLTRRGFGARRVDEALRAAGIADTERATVREAFDLPQRKAAALRFAERRRVGPYASDVQTDPKIRQRLFAAFVRAGHEFALVKEIMALAPGSDVSEWLDDV